LLTQLSALEPAGDLNPATFLDDILLDKKNFENGNFKFSNDQIFNKYQELLAQRRAQIQEQTGLAPIPTPLTAAPPIPTPRQVTERAQAGIQKAIQPR
jgi:hypothetical protein